jgi:phosphatidylglycerol---prolipoprotein diacylglyceryl transferase
VQPLVFHLGPFQIPAYTVCMLTAVILGGWMTYREAARRGRLNETTLTVGSIGLMGGVIGAKLSMLVFLGPRDFFRELSSIPSHGAAFTGAIIGGYVAVVIAERVLGVRQCTGDLVAPFLPLGQAIGRLGNFLAADAYGTPSSVRWAVYQAGAWRHPAQIYELVLDLALFALLWRLRTRVYRNGELFRIYVLGYALIRFPIEFLRYQPTPLAVLGLTLVQWLCLAAIAGAIYQTILQRRGIECLCDLLPGARRSRAAA